MLLLIAVLAIVTLALFAVSNVLQGRAIRRLASVTDVVNLAVNHKEFGMPTLVQRVIDQDRHGVALADDLLAFREWTIDSIQAIADAQGVKLAQHPSPVVTLPVQLPDN